MSEYLDVIVPRGGKIAGRARAARGARAGDRPPGGQLPRVRRSRCRCAHGAHHRPQRQDAPHRHLRRRRDAARRPRAARRRTSARSCATCWMRVARCAVMPQCRRSTRACVRRRRRTGTPSTWTRSSPRAWWTGVDAAIAHIARYGSAHTESHRHRERRHRRALPAAGRQRHRAAQRLDAVRGRRRVRHGRGDRHLHRPLPRPRSGGGRAAHQLQVRGARQRAGAPVG